MNPRSPDGRVAPVPSLSESVVAATRRERKKLATRDALREAAFALVAERSYHAVTVEDIAEAADVSTRTFFNYFPSKEAVLLAGATDSRAEIAAHLESRPADEGPLDALSAVLLAQAQVIEQRADARGATREQRVARMGVILSEPVLLAALVVEFSETERRAAEIIGRRLGLPDDDPYPAVLTAICFAASRAALEHWAGAGRPGSLTELTRLALETVARPHAARRDPPAPLRRHAPATSSRPALKQVAR